MQRLLDIILSSIALLLLAPLLLIIMTLLKFTGEGEVFFVQERIGKAGRKFGLLKFATMLKDSPNLGSGTITTKDDPRILPLGRLLRKTKVNELPQLINILCGHMSIVGPRPQTTRCFNAFPEAIRSAIVIVRPGLSGIGSIVFRSEEEMIHASSDPNFFYDKVIAPYKGMLERWFVEHQSIWIYISVIWLTVWVVFFPKSQLIWRVFPSLPQPPLHLASVLGIEVQEGTKRA